MGLSDYFRAQADWRDGRAAEYPDDQRNAQSAAALRSLAEYVDHEDGERLVDELGLEAHLSEEGKLGGQKTQREVSRYGYGHRVTVASNIDFLEELLALCLADAYEHAVAATGDDPTNSLYAFEIEAAKAGATLPDTYWRWRTSGKQTESEIEAEVELLTADEQAAGGDE